MGADIRWHACGLRPCLAANPRRAGKQRRSNTHYCNKVLNYYRLNNNTVASFMRTSYFDGRQEFGIKQLRTQTICCSKAYSRSFLFLVLSKQRELTWNNKPSRKCQENMYIADIETQVEM